MTATQFEEVDATLLLLSEARERAERAAKTVAEAGGDAHMIAALECVDQELLSLHRRLMDESVFHAPSSQLALA